MLPEHAGDKRSIKKENSSRCVFLHNEQNEIRISLSLETISNVNFQ